MAAVWQVQEAKNRFSEVIEKALSEGPQVVTRHGRPVVKVVAFDEAEGDAVVAKDDGFTEFLMSIPKAGPEGLKLPAGTRWRNRVDLGT
jgi:prevent-host-death family protein